MRRTPNNLTERSKAYDSIWSRFNHSIIGMQRNSTLGMAAALVNAYNSFLATRILIPGLYLCLILMFVTSTSWVEAGRRNLDSERYTSLRSKYMRSASAHSQHPSGLSHKSASY